MDAPCKQCADRAVGCHSVCGKYLAFKAQTDAARDRRAEESMIKGAVSQRVTRVMKLTKWRK